MSSNYGDLNIVTHGVQVSPMSRHKHSVLYRSYMCNPFPINVVISVKLMMALLSKGIQQLVKQ